MDLEKCHREKENADPPACGSKKNGKDQVMLPEEQPFYLTLNPCFNMWKQWPLWGSKWKKEEGNCWKLQQGTVERYPMSRKDKTDIRTYNVIKLFK